VGNGERTTAQVDVIIARCASASPDLVVLDLGLPDMDGQEVIAHIRE
jgi:CheY-like chemotaxis protein